MESKFKELIENIAKIPEDFWIESENHHQVLWLLNREDGSAGNYETSRERLGITKNGSVIWGFSSGCSCWSGWNAEDYYEPVSWKEWVVRDSSLEKEDGWGFAQGWKSEVNSAIDDLSLLWQKEKLDTKRILKVGNAELRRYFIKRIGYENIKSHADVTLIATSGEYELIDVKIDKDITDRYVKVKDSSTDRVYLLSVPNHIKSPMEAVAWTFGLSEGKYHPDKET